MFDGAEFGEGVGDVSQNLRGRAFYCGNFEFVKSDAVWGHTAYNISVGRGFEIGKFLVATSRRHPFIGVGSDFDVREFPEVSVDHSGGPLADEKISFVLTNKRDESAGSGGNLGTEIGQLINEAAAVRGAMGPGGTS